MLTLAKRPTLALDVNIVQDNLPIEIAPKLYLGSIHAAFNQDALSSHKITHILNASRLPPSFPKQFTYLSVDVRDKEDANILSCIPASNIFIEAGMEAGGVLVHCFGGRSRSAAFIAAYLMCHCGWSYEHTLKVIVAARPVASVNKGFEKQLKAYALTNFDVYATQQVLLRNRIKALHGIRALNESKAGFTRGSFREGPIGGNKRSWADRDSFCAKALNLADEEQKAIEEEGVEEEEEADGDEDIESEKDQLSEMDEPSKLLPALSPDNFLKDTKDFPPYLLNNFNSEEETLPCKNRKQRNRVVRISGSMTPLSTKKTSIPYLDPKSPRCRLSRPGSCTVRVIPPLRGLERAVCCAYCGEGLFCLANVLRVNARGGREVEKEVEETRTSYSSASSSSSPSPATSFSTPSPYLSAPLNLSLETTETRSQRSMSHISLDDNKGSNDLKTLKRDLKRDSDGEHKFERTPDLSSTSCSPKGYSDHKRPQSVRGSVKHFDFDFEKPIVTGSSSYPGGKSNGGGRRGFEKECQRSNRFGLSRGSSEDYLEGDEEMDNQRARERDRDQLRETGEDAEDQQRVLWGRSVSDDIIASTYCTNSLRGQKALWKLKEGGLATVSEGSEKALENLNQVLGQCQGQVQVLNGVRRKSLSDVKSPGGPGISSTSFLPDVTSNCSSLLNTWNSADTLYSDRSASAENRRWLARMSLLSAPSTSAVTPSSSSQSPSSTSGHLGDRRNGQVDALKRMRQMAHDDEEAMRLIFCGTDSDPSSSSSGSDVQHLYIEYLAWMDPDGRVLDPGPSDTDDRDRDRDGFKEFSSRSRGGSDQEERARERERDRDRDKDRDRDRDTGEIKCRQCDRLIGKWTWAPTKSQSLTGQLEPPVFMIEKSHVRQADFSLDPSPQSTPCLVDESEECPSGSFSYGNDDI